MTKKERPLNVLWIDDQKDELIEFKILARQNRVIIKNAFKSAEKGIEELALNPDKYDAVILDAIAFKKENQAIGTETPQSLRVCINGIQKIERENKRKIPFGVYTGFHEKIENHIEEEIKIFVKGRDQSKLFGYLKQEVANLADTVIVEKYYDVFQIFDLDLLDAKYKRKLINVLKNIDSNKQIEIEDALTQMRKTLEGIYRKLELEGWIPDNFVKPTVNLEYCQRFLAGLDVNRRTARKAATPEHIGWLLKTIKENTSAIGAHDYQGIVNNYTLKSTVYALMDVLVWFKNFFK